MPSQSVVTPPSKIHTGLKEDASLAALQDMILGLKTVIDQTGSYIFTKDTLGRYTYVNHNIQELFGASFEDIVGKDDSHFFDLELSNELRVNDRRVIDSGETIEQEERNIVKPSGEERFYWTIKKPVRNDHGHIIGMCGISTDITQRKRSELAVRRAEKELSESEEKYRRLFELSEDPMWFIVGDRFAIANQAATRALGYETVEALTDTHPSQLSPEYQTNGQSSYEKANEMMAHAYREGYHRFEWLHKKKNGEKLFVEVSLTRIPYAGGDALYCVWRDITERKQAEQMLCESEESLREAQRIAGIGSYVLDVHSGVWKSSEMLDKLLGIDEVYQHSFEGWAALIHPEERTRIVEYVEREVIAQGGNFDKEYRIIRHDDKVVRWVYGIGKLEFDSEGHPLKMRGTIQDITERKRIETEILNYANYDQLTMMPNRRLFHDRLEQEVKKAQREKQVAALLFIDLDHFKEVNDTLGHDIGDKLLVEAARRIKHCVRDYDTVARLGGDEFTVILSQLNDVSDIGRIAQNIIDRLSESFNLYGRESYVSASIGIALYPVDATNLTDLIKHADQAMYKAKNDGRSCFRFFIKAMQETAELRMQLASDLRQAIKSEQLEVYYQPIVALDTGRIDKAEALLRWRHPEHGFISPTDFIPIAEDTGTIHDIGDWVFMQAAQQVKKLISDLGREFQISINKSPVQFIGDAREHNHWIEKLKEMGLSGSSIAVEITEGLLMNNDANINDKLLRFRDAGIQVAIDDFGTGYSSLAYLKKFDIDFLKIDQSFTRNLAPEASDFALCEAIVVMAHKLGLKVIAEGVETEQQRDLLRQIGCDYAQGYLFSRPVPAGEFEKLLV